jgi:isopentenyl-diphosphate delta-isomerase
MAKGTSQIEKRKEEHILASLKNESQYKKTTGLEDVELLYNALPEINYDAISTKAKFLGKPFNHPLCISAMTGGFSGARTINLAFAEMSEKHKIPMGLGSQRAMVENTSLKDTYYVKKDYPGAFVIGNIGGIQLKRYDIKRIEAAASSIEADAMAVHLNPLQEVIQPEGDSDWEGVYGRIAELKDELKIPVIVKEVGGGISKGVAFRLGKIGIEWIDVAGSGGTSWSRVEYLRDGKVPGFEEWGIPTALSIIMASPFAKVIATGGIRSGIDGAKSFALGADMFGAAMPFLKAYKENALEKTIDEWLLQFRHCMFLTGSKDIESLKAAPYLLHGRLKEYYDQMN